MNKIITREVHCGPYFVKLQMTERESRLIDGFTALPVWPYFQEFGPEDEEDDEHETWFFMVGMARLFGSDEVYSSDRPGETFPLDLFDRYLPPSQRPYQWPISQ